MMASTSPLADPGKALPRDPTGSYLHLKLKRFTSIKDLTMPYAKKTWQQFPHDASVAMAPNGRALCRQCHAKIEQGTLRYQLLLQCHKGCKNSAFFHADCLWQYPETKKIDKVEEFDGLDRLPPNEKESTLKRFEKFANSPQTEKTPTPGKKLQSGKTKTKRREAANDSTTTPAKKSRKYD
jgi:hypothetical protein